MWKKLRYVALIATVLTPIAHIHTCCPSDHLLPPPLIFTKFMRIRPQIVMNPKGARNKKKRRNFSRSKLLPLPQKNRTRLDKSVSCNTLSPELSLQEKRSAMAFRFFLFYIFACILLSILLSGCLFLPGTIEVVPACKFFQQNPAGSGMLLAIQQVGSILFHNPVFLTGRVRTTT